jgi:hypothetical protein
MNRHTIILVQPTAGKASRTFADFETVPLAMDGVCQMFEKRLKERNPSMRSITYDINDLYHYIDLLPDLSALVLAPGASTLSVGCCKPRWAHGRAPQLRRAWPAHAPCARAAVALARLRSGCVMRPECSARSAVTRD